MSAIRSLLSSIRCSVKRRDLYESTQKQLEITVTMPSLDVETRWSSTFHTITKTKKARPILKSIKTRNTDSKSFAISVNDWQIASTVAKFLHTAASLTECQSGSHYATLSMNIKAFRALASKCHVAINAGDPVLKPIAEKMLSKIDKYDGVLSGELAQLAKILDTRFGNDILADSNMLRMYVELPVDGEPSTVTNRNEVMGSSGSDFMCLLLEEDSMNECFDDEIILLLRNTAIGKKRVDHFTWWKANEKGYPNVALLARDTLSIQASSVASEEAFLEAISLVTACRTRLSDESISSSMLVRKWARLIREWDTPKCDS